MTVDLQRFHPLITGLILNHASFHPHIRVNKSTEVGGGAVKLPTLGQVVLNTIPPVASKRLHLTSPLSRDLFDYRWQDYLTTLSFPTELFSDNIWAKDHSDSFKFSKPNFWGKRMQFLLLCLRTVACFAVGCVLFVSRNSLTAQRLSIAFVLFPLYLDAICHFIVKCQTLWVTFYYG